jgi:hypothetical protein
VGKGLREAELQLSIMSRHFVPYLYVNFGEGIISMLDKLSNVTQVLIFSGVIRNFILDKRGCRDLDIVLTDKVSIEEFFNPSLLKRNSFGGYKIQYNGLTVDLWYLEETWDLKDKMVLPFDLMSYIPSTAFFNFSSVVYNYTTKKFIATNDFLKFIKTKEMDIVNERNINKHLCIVNTFYYRDTYALKISNRLAKYVKKYFAVLPDKYSAVQIKHWGFVRYSYHTLSNMVSDL